MKLRRWICTALEVVKLHRADCERCGRFEECWGEEIRKRLQELREIERSASGEVLPTTTDSHNDAA